MARKAVGAEYSDLREPVYLVPPEARGSSAVAVAWRPLGYAALALLWAAIGLLGFFFTVVYFPMQLASPGSPSLGESPGFTGSNAVPGLLVSLLLLPFLGAIEGVIVCACLSQFLASATYVVRSLTPGYRSERLSATARSVGAEAAGAASLVGFSTAFSLLPVRLTRWTKIVAVIGFQAFVVNLPMIVVGWCVGFCYVFTVGWVLWPAKGAAAVVCTAVTVIASALTLWIAWRFRHWYPAVMPTALRGTPYERSWPNRPQPKPLRTAARKASPNA